MKLLKFRIHNYKSIKDSHWCWLASDVTILAGKNESGKSATIEALSHFDTDFENVPDGARPLDGNNSENPAIEMCFKVEKETLDCIARKADIPVAEEVCEDIAQKGVKIIKHYDGTYSLGDETNYLINEQRGKANKEHREKINKITTDLSGIEQLSVIERPELEGDIATIRQSVDQYIDQVNGQIPSITDPETMQKANKEIGELTEENKALEEENAADKFLDVLKEYIPNFIFFSDFSDILPFEVQMAEVGNSKPVRDFAKAASLNLDEVISETNTQRRRNILSKHSADISGNFMGYWEQDKLELVAEPDGEILRLGVKEKDKTMLFKAEQRSKGFQWFLSFYLRLNAERKGANIILIDEPGLYLHAKAQKDVLKVLETISKESQVIFSTHSPYLIDPQRLDRLRLILKNREDGTRIENKIHKEADAETLTPITTAIGLDISDTFSIAGEKNVLLEGISDYYFVQALREYTATKKTDFITCVGSARKGEDPETMPATNKTDFIPCVGAQKIPQIVSLLIGWDLDFVVVVDHDREGKKIAKELQKKLSVEQKRVIFVLEQDGSIEDLFAHEDFNNFVLEDTKNKEEMTPNSQFLKDNNLDKVLLAKTFFEKVKEDKSKINLSPNTVKTFENLFKKIDAAFKVSKAGQHKT